MVASILIVVVATVWLLYRYRQSPEILGRNAAMRIIMAKAKGMETVWRRLPPEGRNDGNT